MPEGVGDALRALEKLEMRCARWVYVDLLI